MAIQRVISQEDRVYLDIITDDITGFITGFRYENPQTVDWRLQLTDNAILSATFDFNRNTTGVVSRTNLITNKTLDDITIRLTRNRGQFGA